MLLCFLVGFVCILGGLGLLQDRLRLLRSWVMCDENRAACESQVVLSKEKSESNSAEREPWSVRDMLQANWPIEKIRSIVARGGATPDPDCPEVEECFQYWVITRRRRTSAERTSQTASTHIQVETTPTGIGELLTSSFELGAPAAPRSTAAGLTAPAAVGVAADPADLVARVQQSMAGSGAWVAN